jgi:DNA-binding LacI/PurR family transcriptional regulator
MVTIRQIAREAGVSVGTVSNVLNSPDMVAVETRRRVTEVINHHSYEPSAIARSLSTRRTRTIGLIVSSIFNPFTAELVEGASQAAAELGCALLLTSAQVDGSDIPQHVDTLVQHWVDGIFLAAQPLPEGMYAELRFGATPTVIMDHGQTPPSSAVGLIGFEWQSAAYQATHHLIELGHTRIGYVGGIPDRSSTIARELGYRQALAEAGIPYQPELHLAGDFLTEGGYHCAMQLLRRADRPSGLVMANDMMALGVYRAAAELGLRVPQDVSVVGIDNILLALHITPPLTTVDVPTAELGRVGIRMLSQEPDPSKPPVSVTLSTKLVVRDSTAPIAQPVSL